MIQEHDEPADRRFVIVLAAMVGWVIGMVCT